MRHLSHLKNSGLNNSLQQIWNALHLAIWHTEQSPKILHRKFFLPHVLEIDPGGQQLIKCERIFRGESKNYGVTKAAPERRVFNDFTHSFREAVNDLTSGIVIFVAKRRVRENLHELRCWPPFTVFSRNFNNSFHQSQD